tara:strand:+ start:1229 stop:1699 length:471 start_codon:yes stop_codon:yes gene_type:complete
MSYTKKKLYKNRKNFSKNRTKLHKFRKHKKRINSKKKHYKKNHKKITKKYKKIMKGGVAPFLSTSYTKSDTPIGPPSAISYIPAPLMNLKWSMDSSAKNFVNELFGQPRQYTSSPTDQPIGDKKISLETIPITSGKIDSITAGVNKAIIDSYNSGT